ncbi:MAG: hypothetical protein HRT72_10455 [Flavobacteriales bacterium]|nr:hypothetical protein [Flavobacteriales bacterium]
MLIVLRNNILNALLLSILFAGSAIAQDVANSLLLMNGYEITLRSFEEDLTTKTVRYSFEKKGLIGASTKVVEDEIAMARLFSLNLRDGTEQLYYKQDSTEGNFYPIDRARMFVFGSRDAQRNYDPIIPLVGGIVGGLTGGLFNSIVLTPLISAASLITPVVRTTKIGEYEVDHNSLAVYGANSSDLDYQDGFYKIAKSKRVQKTIVGSIIGIVGGIGLAKIASHNGTRVSITQD